MLNFGDEFLGIACTLEAETSVVNFTQYKLFIGDDKKNTISGVTFSFKKKYGYITEEILKVKFKFYVSLSKFKL